MLVFVADHKMNFSSSASRSNVQHLSIVVATELPSTHRRLFGVGVDQQLGKKVHLAWRGLARDEPHTIPPDKKNPREDHKDHAVTTASTENLSVTT